MLYGALEMPETCPFWERHVTLARVLRGDLVYAKNVREKQELLASAAQDVAEAIYFVAWTGQWTTDLFVVTPRQLGLLHTMGPLAYTGRPAGIQQQ